MFIKRGMCLILCSLWLCGCTQPKLIPSVEVRIKHADKIAETVGWQSHTLHTSKFTFKAYMPNVLRKNKTITIYIEGDGFSWKTADTPSDNPTPITPLGLILATHDKHHTPVVYLARACQFVIKADRKNCQVDYWTNKRFSPEIIQASNQAIDAIKARYAAQRITLIGYSGGGTIAALITAQRTDVVRLITIAGVLDTAYWVQLKSLTPLTGSLNPVDFWKSLASIPQTHWVGGNDSIVPKGVALSYAKHFPLKQQPDIKVMPTFDHACCWGGDWTPYLSS